jgi:hypothetical protein
MNYIGSVIINKRTWQAFTNDSNYIELFKAVKSHGVSVRVRKDEDGNIVSRHGGDIERIVTRIRFDGEPDWGMRVSSFCEKKKPKTERYNPYLDPKQTQIPI